MCEPLGVTSVALVAWGSAGRGCRVERVSKGWSGSGFFPLERSLTVAGVGVAGGSGGFAGDAAVGLDLRFLGRGVAGSDGGAVVEVDCSMSPSSSPLAAEFFVALFGG